MKIEDIIKTTSQIAVEKKAIISLVYTANIISDKLSEVLKVYDISIQQYNVLRILRGQKGKPANLSTIQERMINKMSNTTRLVDKLILKDLVTRNICELNRRKVEIFITENGLKLLNILDPLVDKTEKEIVKNLSADELNTVNDLLEKIRD
ncbi:MarR family winged helix-turn-helix transcriptional regulator [Abyssalbus ytuae]|uniref:MarR family transcriptional regulator n=1 Tax=Abyssalbus ytuae TaxID=2926907 RepID=A0A9E6ZM70_9FLAO|nr:MarR family transcriptional regulator [Abyssalbus ytuae]UOB16850.1 MarR family transcriptional regulator [Abyssalbus ytuae]